MACDIAYQAEARVEVCVYQYDFLATSSKTSSFGRTKEQMEEKQTVIQTEEYITPLPPSITGQSTLKMAYLE